MRFVRCVFRWSFYVMGVWLLFVAYLVLGHVFPIVGYMAYILPFVGVAYLFRHRLARRLPWVAVLLTRFPRRMKHRFERAFKDEIGEDGKPSVPKVERIEHLDDERIRYHLTLPANQNFRGLSQNERAKVEARWEWLLNCRKVTIHSDTLRGRQGTVTVDHLPEPPEPDHTQNLGPWPGWPGADDFSKPIPLGIAAKTGDPVGLRLFSGGMKNILIFGVPGSGKSVGAAEIIATAAQDLTVDLWGLDGGGGTDMEFWRHRMSHYEVKIERAFLMIQELKAEVDRRSEAMVAARRRVIGPHDPKILLVMEEFATFTDEKRKRCIATGQVRSGKEDDPSESFADALAYVGRLGRKYGVGIVLITQVPTVKTIPSQLRGLVQYAWGFRCRDRGGWQAGFGGGVPFVRLDKSRAGTSILLAENDEPLLIRSYFISDEELEEIAAATSLAPVDSLAPDMDTIPADLCLETAEFGAAPSEIAAAPGAAPGAAPYVPDAWDLAVLAAATDGRTGPDLYNNLVGGLSAGAARKRLKILTGAGYLSAPPRPKVTDPQLYVTTITGREALKREGAQ